MGQSGEFREQPITSTSEQTGMHPRRWLSHNFEISGRFIAIVTAFAGRPSHRVEQHEQANTDSRAQ
jgi:hypothetical protein